MSNIVVCTTKKADLIDEILSLGYLYHTPTPTREDMEHMPIQKLHTIHKTVMENIMRSGKLYQFS